MSTEHWNGLVEEFGRNVGLPDMSLGELGLCRVELDSIAAIDFEIDHSGQLNLYCVLPAVASLERAALHEQMLAANYAGHRERVKAMFCVDPATGESLLHLLVPSHVTTLDEFGPIVKDFSAIAHAWCIKCRDGVEASIANPTSPNDPSLYV
jgi:hypothetical protein